MPSKFSWKVEICSSPEMLRDRLNRISDTQPQVLLDPGTGDGWKFILVHKKPNTKWEEPDEDEAPV